MSRRARLDKNMNLARCKNKNSGAVEKKRQKSVTYAGVAELADAPDLGSGGRPWGFESLHPHEIRGFKAKAFWNPLNCIWE